jgi:hypothetical protein
MAEELDTEESGEDLSLESKKDESGGTDESSGEIKKSEPPEGSKRWNEIYYKMKEFERQLEEKDKTLEAVIDHNRSLQESMDGLYDKVSASDRPDPITDPEGYDKWILDRARREVQKGSKPKNEKAVKATPEKIDKVNQQVGIMRSLYDDYDQVTSLAKEFINKDPVKKNDIAFSDNPPRALYEYGLEKKKAIGNNRDRNLDAARAEGGALPAGNKKTTELTPAQERARLGLGISKEAYMKQLEIIEKKRGY